MAKVKREDLTLHPTSRSQRYMSLSGADTVYVIIVGLTLWIGTDLITQPLRSWITVVGGVGFLLSLMRVSKYERRVYTLPEYFIRNFWTRKIQHRRRWSQGSRSSTSAQAEGGHSKPGQSILPIRAVRFGDIGTVVNERFRMITFVVKVSGTNISTKTISEQKAWYDRLSEALKYSVAAARGRSPLYSPWIGMVYRSRPGNPYEYEKILRDIVDFRVLLPEGETKPQEQWTDDDYLDAFGHQVVVTDSMENYQSLVNSEMVFTFSVRYSRYFKKVLRAAEKSTSADTVNFDHKHLLREPFYRLRDAVVPLLEDVMTGDVNVLDFDELLMYLRMGHDMHIEDYYRRAYLAELKGESLPSTSWMPERFIDEHNDKLNANGSWGAVLAMTSFPDGFAMPMTAREFYTPRTMHYAATSIGKVTKGNHRYRYTRGAGAMTDGAMEFFGIDKGGPKADQAAQQVYNQQAQLSQSGWAATYQPMISISKTSEAKLEEAVEHVRARLDGALFEPQRVIGESAQWETFFVASTGIPLRF